jgi:hypothetical protein
VPTVNATAKTGTPTGTLVEVFKVSTTGVRRSLVTTTTTAADRTFSFTAAQSGAQDSYLVKVNTGFSQNYSIVVPAGAGPFLLTDIIGSAGAGYTPPSPVTSGGSNTVADATSIGNDTTALQAFITANAGKTIQIGNHTITSTLTIPSDTTIRGKDSTTGTIKIPAGGNFTALNISTANRVKIQNLKLTTADGNVGGASAIGVKITGDCSDVTLTDVTITKMQTSFYVAGSAGATVKRATLTNCYSLDSGSSGYGFEVDDSDGLTLINCKSLSSGLDGLKLREMTSNVLILGGYFTGAVGGDGMDCFAGGNNFTVIGTTFSGNTINGITIKCDNLNQSNPTVYGAYVGNVTLTGIRCNNNGGYGMTFHRHGSTDDVTMPLPARCTVNGGNFSGNTNSGILVRGRQVTLSGVQTYRNGQYGIDISSTAMDVALVGVQVSGNSQTTVNTYSGIRVAGDRVQIVGGWSIGADADNITSEADLAAATKQQKYGLEILSTATNLDVNSAFRARYNATANFNDLGTNTIRTMPGVAQMPSAGRYLTQPFSTRSTLALVQSVEYATPIYIGESGTVVRIAAEVTAVGGAGSTVRLALRKNVNNFPGPLVGQGTIDGTSATVQEITVSWDIPAGIYWLTATGQGGTPTVRAVTGAFAPVSWSTLASTFSATPLAGYITAATVTGVLTDTYTIANRAGVVPLVALRY